MKKILLLLAVAPLLLLSCSKETSLEEMIAEEEELLTGDEKLLLHQTPKFNDNDIEADNNFNNLKRQVETASSVETVNGWRITKNGQGLVTQVLFNDITQQMPPSDGKAFLTQFFGDAAAAQFVEVDNGSDPERTEMFVQYCGDMEVSDYAFIYDEQGVMQRAFGAYYPTDGLNTTPTISSYVARMVFASYLQQSVKLVNENTRLRIELIPEGTRYVPTLVYNLRLNEGSGSRVENRVAWVDAHTGRLLRVCIMAI